MPKEIKFKDYPDFTPNLTPEEIYRLGSLSFALFFSTERICSTNLSDLLLNSIISFDSSFILLIQLIF